jgi:hypothetical protein
MHSAAVSLRAQQPIAYCLLQMLFRDNFCLGKIVRTVNMAQQVDKVLAFGTLIATN